MNPSSIKPSGHAVLILILSLSIYSCNDEIAYPEGGYLFPAHVEDKDTTFYYYPLKDIQSTRDSFETANNYNFFRFFDEYNLSLRPANKETFRLIYSGGEGNTIIILHPDEIIVKKQIKGWPWCWHDTAKLNEKEKFLFDKFERFYPYSDSSYSKRLNKYLDSLTKANPELFDANYYRLLLDKSADYGKEKFEYSLKRIPINEKSFVHFVNLINESGYWKLPFDNWCKNVPTHASVFIFEANTSKKYNVVKSISCPDDTTKYVKACQELIKLAGIDQEISLIWGWPASTDEPIKVRELELTEIKEDTPPPKRKKKKEQ